MANCDDTCHPAISVVIVTGNRRDDLAELLGCLYVQDFRGLEVVLVDNGSTDGTQEAVLAAHPHVGHVVLHKNLRLSAGRNIGAANSQGQYLLFLSNDLVLADPDIFRIIMDLSERPRDCAAISREDS